ncbi:HalOD1 output domain-containing protein [Halomarina litorea]|uniref:HalOD1 output domain-containing protein n=1 Tax=Halomarina litorea TaxID=2961595 RepID=UPI0020C24429|nr:HalOD1 output domain-containing protein [Halomarina sp. BCD28]
MSTLDSRNDVQPRPVTTDSGDAYCATHDLTTPGSLSITIVETVCAVLEESPAAVEPLYDVVDPDALDSLFRPKADGTPRVEGSVTFTLSDCTVTVEGTGEVVVVPPDGD